MPCEWCGVDCMLSRCRVPGVAVWACSVHRRTFSAGGMEPAACPSGDRERAAGAGVASWE